MPPLPLPLIRTDTALLLEFPEIVPVTWHVNRMVPVAVGVMVIGVSQDGATHPTTFVRVAALQVPSLLNVWTAVQPTLQAPSVHSSNCPEVQSSFRDFVTPPPNCNI